MEEIDEMFTFPGADAKPDPEPTTTIRPPKNEIVNKSEEVNEEATPEPLSEIVDIIKNDNNVVAFFCKESFSFTFAFKNSLSIVKYVFIHHFTKEYDSCLKR